MKNLLKCTLPIVLALLFAFPVFAQTAEESIKKTCLAETQAWLDADFDAYAATHAHHENEALVWTNPDGSFGNVAGWEAVSTEIKKYMSGRAKDPAKLSGDSFKFIIQSSMAFVMYDQTLTASDGKISKSREIRTMILTDGQWKIAAVMAFYDHSGDKK